MSYLDSPIFLCGHRKTGTTVLLCLFDSHPQLLTYPADSGFFYRVFPPCETLKKSETIDTLIKYSIYESLGPGGDAIGGLVSGGQLTKEQGEIFFQRELIADSYRKLAEASKGTPADHLRSLIEAYGNHCGQDCSRWLGWMEKTTSTEMYALEIAQWFPRAKFIHLLRDPRDNYASLKSGWKDRYQDWENTHRSLLQSMIDRGGLGMRLAKINQNALGEDFYKIIRFEDLVSDPELNISELLKFIGIEHDSTLHQPTVNGVPWSGNNFEGLRFNGLSGANVGKWSSRIEPWEVSTIEGYLGGIMETFDYELSTEYSDQARACIDHYKWFNFLPKETRGGS